MKHTTIKSAAKYIAAVTVLLFLATLSACTRKIHTCDVSFRQDTAIYNGKPFSGEIWTDDDESGFFLTEEGQLKGLTFYHRNGKEAITMKRINDGAPEIKIYDDKGDSIDLVTFQQKYADIFINMAMVQGNLMAQ